MRPVTSGPLDLFVYGTLMDDALVVRLTGRHFRKEAASLPGYRRVAPEGGYPYILPATNAVVDGVVLLDVHAEALRIFDRYEDAGRLYIRSEVVVTVAAGLRRALTYVGIPKAHRTP